VRIAVEKGMNLILDCPTTEPAQPLFARDGEPIPNSILQAFHAKIMITQ
jgi:hypothetical protein